jgi:hypothetical protein
MRLGLVLLIAGAILVMASVVLYVWRGRRPTAPTASAVDPLHSLGVSIRARGLRNEAGGAILASGPGSFVDIVSEDVANAGVVFADQGGPGVRLVDHARVIAGHISKHAADWEQRAAGSGRDAAFAAEYVKFGYGRQAGELYDSAARVGLTTPLAKAEFQRAAVPGAAHQVASELVRWADDLDQRRSSPA